MTPAKLAINTSGTPTKGRIYALHGVTDNAAALCDVSERWSGEFEVVCVDALGHGCSPRFTAEQLEDPFEALVQSAAAVINRIEADDPAPFVLLMGHSMGGATSADIVSRGLAHVDALVLEDPALFTADNRRDSKTFGEHLVKWCNHVTDNLGHEVEQILEGYPLWSRAEATGWAQAKVQVDRNFLSNIAVSSARTRNEILESLQTPTLLITGDGDDVVIGPAGVADIDKLGLEKVTTLLIPTARHCVRRSTPEPFYAAVESFIAKLGPKG